MALPALANVENVPADLALADHIPLPVGRDVIRMVPERAPRRVLEPARQDLDRKSVV